MPPAVTVVDFGAGNLRSVCQALDHCGATVARARTADQVMAADRLILPGVGAFGACFAGLRDQGLIEPLRAFAASGRPFLGICVGMQMMFDESLEFGLHPGLGLIPGRVEPVPPAGADGRAHRIPHIGWNALRPVADWAGTPLAAIVPGESVYFIHSFAGHASNPAHRLAECDYDGVPLLAAVRRDNLTGCQFHPEKSGPMGLRLLGEFLRG
ncbi:MAG: imidazole glycerol phosphate synthase subunit HisH [Alphaproteobacteria bacterium]|nr:imidazole glycerol phosphate synthase subunit HisH [Alphaproteobacteria bacterium]